MIILGTNSIKETGFNVANSARFGVNTYMHKAFSSDNEKDTWTFSLWVKRGNSGSTQRMMTHNGATSGKFFYLRWESNEQLHFHIGMSDGNFAGFDTTQVFRDHSAWYHIVCAVDTTQGTEANRVKIYVNGSQVTAFGTANYPAQNTTASIGRTDTPMVVGALYGSGYGITSGSPQEFYDGYLAEVCFIDDAQLAADQFGEFDEDSAIWKPKDVSGLTFGTDGFYLDFEDSSNLGNDANGGTDLTETNLTATDQATDTCTLNYNTMDPLNMPTSNKPTFSEGNLKTVTSSSGSGRFGGTSTFGVTQGKWYVEAKATVGSTYSRNSIGVSYNPAEMVRNNSDNTLTDTSYAWGWDSSGGDVYHDSSVVVNYATYTTGDICQIFLDLDNHKLYYGKNGTLQSSTGISLDTGQTYFIAQIDRTSGSDTSTFEFNFGSPIYAISSSNTDGKYGNFEYSTTITGDGASKTFKALNSANLAEFG